MKYSNLFGQATKNELKETKFISHYLLYKAGFIRESTAGRYYFLPLGWRVHRKIKNIIRQEMDQAGAQEMLAPVLHPIELWQETKRTEAAGFELTSVTDRRGAEFALGGTAEEMFVDLVRKFQLSYKDLPFNLYQFSTKFRDELRARGGLLRVREFTMKDAYSFHDSETDFQRHYELMTQTYFNIFERLDLEVMKVAADNGYIGGEYCHEFQVESPVGEDRFFVSEDGQYLAHEDVAEFELELVNPDEEIKEMEIVEQPAWVKSIEDNVKHYGQDRRHFLKNVVYKSDQGDIIIVTIRGDLEVNQVKLLNLLNQNLDFKLHQLTDATAEDLTEIGTQPGYVHAWGHQFAETQPARIQDRSKEVIYVADESLKTVKNIIGGQKEETTDSINVNYGRDFKHEIEGDVAMAQAGFISPTDSPLIEKTGIEVGNIFQLGYHYSQLMQATFTDQENQNQPFYMGCYGIGLGRTMASIVETHHDENGMIWPVQIAPFTAHLISLPGGEEQAEAVYQALTEDGFEVLWDEREVSAGEKFAEADLIGNPVRLVVSSRSGEKIEWKRRTEQKTELLSLAEVKERFSELVETA